MCSGLSDTTNAFASSRASKIRSEPDAAGHVTVLLMQSVGTVRYFDAAGYPGRTLGLPAE